MSFKRRSFLTAGAMGGLLAAMPRAWAAKPIGYPRALQGPMVGAPGPNQLSVWVRASGAYPVTLEVSADRDFSSVVATASAKTEADTDCCAVLRADGLEPDTNYWYRLKYAGDADRYQPLPHRARTAPSGPADFRVAFGSCCRIQTDPDQRIWNAVAGLDPDFFLWLGDNIYADSDDPGAITALYGQSRTVERLEPFLRGTPQLATWDDHDFGYNDSDGTNPIKASALRIFKNYWANPSYGEPGNPGVYFKQHYGGVDFFVLDGRYYRSPTSAPDDAKKTMLGATQKAWLKRELRASRTPFKVLAIGSSWSAAEAREQGDSWGVFRTERDELFDFIRDENISGVVCISGDTHMGELNCIPRSAVGGYDLYDLCSSPLAQIPAAKNLRQVPEVRVRDAWTRSVNVGLMRFAMRGATPTLTFTLHDPLGKSVWDPLVLTPDDLKNGVRTWDKKSDPDELERLARHKRGGGYYGFDPEPGVKD